MATKEQERTRRGRRPAASRQQSGPAVQEQQRFTKPAQEVVYQPPKPFNRNRFLLRLITAAAVVIALILGVSVFFKVESVEVSGCVQYSAWTIREASGIEDGENLLTLSRAKAAARIIAALPYVDSVRIGIKLPGTVILEIKETQVTYCLQGEKDTWWLVSSSGKVVEKITEEQSLEHTRICGVTLAEVSVGDQAKAKEDGDNRTDAEGNVIPVTVTQAEKLETALKIARYLEASEVLGQAASIDVADLGKLSFWYGEQYQVLLGDSAKLEYKIQMVKSAIDSGRVGSGILDATLTVQTDGIICRDFE